MHCPTWDDLKHSEKPAQGSVSLLCETRHLDLSQSGLSVDTIYTHGLLHARLSETRSTANQLAQKRRLEK